MVIALFILMVVILLTAEYFSISKKLASGVLANSASPNAVSTEVIDRYFHRGHAWALVGPSKDVVVGVDDFAQKFIGTIDCVELPKVGTLVRQGDRMMTMKHGAKSLSPAAPVTGTVVEVNPRLKTDPGSINDSPLDKGWILRISPANLAAELRLLLKGVIADRWQEAVRAHLLHWFAPRVGPVMADGGTLVKNISDAVSDDEWRLLVDEFFKEYNTDTNVQ